MQISRKDFLKAFGATLAASTSFLYPGAVGVARSLDPRTTTSRSGTSPQSLRLDGPDATFATGRVVAKSADGTVIQNDESARAIRFLAGTLVWKEVLVPSDVIQLGDWLHAKGTPLADGSLVARSEWVFVNIGRRGGTVLDASPAGVTVRHDKGTDTFELSPTLTVVSVKTGTPLQGGVHALKPGMDIGAVGLRLPHGKFRATKIWA